MHNNTNKQLNLKNKTPKKVTKKSKYAGYFLSQLVTDENQIFFLLPGKRNFSGVKSTLFHGGNFGRVKLAINNQTLYVVKTGENEAMRYEAYFYETIGKYNELLINEEADKYYLIMPYYSGVTLYKALNFLLEKFAVKQNITTETDSIISLLICVLTAISNIHKLGICHNDLHLGNIICDVVNNQWECHVIDPRKKESKGANNVIFQQSRDIQVLLSCINAHISGYTKYFEIKNNQLNKIMFAITQDKKLSVILNDLNTLRSNCPEKLTTLLLQTPKYYLNEKQRSIIETNTASSKFHQIKHLENYCHRYLMSLMYAITLFLTLIHLPVVSNELFKFSALSITFGAITLGIMIEYFDEIKEWIAKDHGITETPEIFHYRELLTYTSYYEKSHVASDMQGGMLTKPKMLI